MVSQFAIAGFSGCHQFTHDRNTLWCRSARLIDYTETRCQHQTRDPHGQLVDCSFRVAVFVRQHLALLGELDLSVYGAFRLRQNRFVRWTAAAAYGTTTTVEQAALDTMTVCQRDDFSLGFEQLPRGGKYAAVFARIGVT